MPGRGSVDEALWDNRERDPARLRMEFRGPKGRGWLMRWLPARAWENGVYAVFANNIGRDGGTIKPGLSMIFDPAGEVLAECHALGDDVVVALLTADALVDAPGRRYLRARRPELELFGPSEYGYELTSPEDSPFPLEVGLHGDHASMSVAYWDLGDRESELAELVVEIATALRDETGWVIFDPQSERIVEMDDLRRWFESGHAWGVDRVAEIAAETQRPKRKLFFGLF